MSAWLLASLLGARVAASIMNQGGVPYAISNPPGSSPGWHGTPGTYSTDFETNVAGEVEHFDVYGEVQTLYSQVRCTLWLWAMEMEIIEIFLPDANPELLPSAFNYFEKYLGSV